MSNEHVIFNVDGMTGPQEAEAIKTVLSIMNGVVTVMADVDLKRIAVEYDAERMHTDTLRGTIEDAGYKVK